MNRVYCVAVVTLIAALPAPSNSADGDREALLTDLRTKFNDAYDAGDHALAIRIGLRVSARTDDHIDLYNLACAYSLHGDPENAIVWLSEIADTGFAQPGLLETDPDLRDARTDPRFRGIVRTVRQNVHTGRPGATRPWVAREPIIIAPAKIDAECPAPLIMVLHGYSGSHERTARLWKRVAAAFDAILVAPSGQEFTPHGGRGWATVTEADRTVMHALQRARDQYNVDSDRIVVAGISQGARMASHMAARHPETFRGLIMVAAAYNHGTLGTLRKTPRDQRPTCYIMVGDRDRLLAGSRAAVMDLEDAEVPYELVLYPDLGHSYPPNTIVELRKAVRYVLSLSDHDSDEALPAENPIPHLPARDDSPASHQPTWD